MNNRNTPLALAVLAASVITMPLSAQNVLEEVVVVAQKREQGLQGVPVAVFALGGDALQQAGVTTLSDVSQMVPGLSITQTQSEASAISMRGVSSNDFGFAVEQSIPVYWMASILGLVFRCWEILPILPRLRC